MSNLQLELLRFYGNGVSDGSLREIKTILSKYFANKTIAERANSKRV